MGDVKLLKDVASEATLASALAGIVALGQAADAQLAFMQGRDPAISLGQLQALLPLTVKDRLPREILTPDQLGADAVLTFNLGAASSLVVVNVDPIDPEDDRVYLCRASLGATDPAANLGHRCRSGQATYIPFPCAGTVKVFAPAGVSVSVEAG